MQSEEIKDLAAALAKAQAEFEQPKRNSTAVARGSAEYKYADLSAVLDAVIPSLSKHGIGVAQVPRVTEEGRVMTTVLMHESGQWLCGSYPLPSTASSQEMGSAITYARRYSLSAMVGVASEDDDDGAQAERGAAKQKAKKQAPPKDTEPTAEVAAFPIQKVPAEEGMVAIRDMLIKEHKDVVKAWVPVARPQLKRDVIPRVEALIKQVAPSIEFTTLGEMLPEEIKLAVGIIAKQMKDTVAEREKDEAPADDGFPL